MVYVIAIILILALVLMVHSSNESYRVSDVQSFDNTIKGDINYHSEKWHIGLNYDKEKQNARIINYDNKKYKDIQCKELGEVMMFDRSLIFLDKGSDSITFASLEKYRDLDVKHIDNFSADKIFRNQEHSKYNSFYPECFVAVSSNYKKICFLNSTEKPLEAKVVSFSDIISVEIIENGTTTFSKSTTRTIGGALVGNVLMGGAGAVVGGLSGDTKKTDKVKSIAVKVLVRNIDEPAIMLTIYEWGETKTDSDKYKSYSGYAKKIKDIISVIIDSVDNEEKSTPQNTVQSNTNITDELMKIAKLKEEGILTEEEFSKMKAKLLNQ